MLARRGPDGDWGNPFVVAKDEPLENLVMPRSSPPNFVPLAWAPADGKARWVKKLRVPAEKLIR